MAEPPQGIDAVIVTVCLCVLPSCAAAVTKNVIMMVMMMIKLMFVSCRLQVSRPHSAFSPVSFTSAFTGTSVFVCVLAR